MSEIGKINPEIEINKIQKKSIRDTITEMLTPLQRKTNVDFKAIRKVLDECVKSIEGHKEKQKVSTKDIDEMKRAITHTLKNSDNDKKVLNRELVRMQHIDRLKVTHANNAFYNADNGSMLPSLNTAIAASRNDLPAFMT